MFALEKFAAIQPVFYIISYFLSGQLYRTSDAQNVILFSLNAFIVKYASCGMHASISYLTAKVRSTHLSVCNSKGSTLTVRSCQSGLSEPLQVHQQGLKLR